MLNIGKGAVTMITSSVRNARLNLSKLLDLVAQGEQVVVRNRKVSVAKIVPFSEKAVSGLPDLTLFRESLRKRSARRGKESTAMIRRDREGRG
jgi:antitoxin (DNA-binding transcriptional repressor) of toxin-antitoxin stability system